MRLKRIGLDSVLERLSSLDRESLVRVPDVCTCGKMRLKRRLGCLGANELQEVDAKLRLHLEL